MSRSPQVSVGSSHMGGYPVFRRQGFSLIELLIVIAIIGLLVGLAVPALQIVAGLQLKTSADSIADVISIARQEAFSKGRETRVEFLREQDGQQSRIRAYRLVEVVRGERGGFSTNRVTRVTRVPDSIVLRESESPIVADYGAWRGFSFSPGGRPEGLSLANNYLVLEPRNTGGQNAGNFIVVQVNPVTGKVQRYQP